MTSARPNAEQVATLAALANGIIPPDEIDGGAEAVNAGPRLAERLEAGVHRALYFQGLQTADALANEKYARPVNQLSGPELHDLLAAIRETLPAFFKQLRLDVSALYLSDPEVWRRIGFPGPSTETGGYPDFDQPPAKGPIYLDDKP
jgi:hypothetical protein